MSALAIYDTYCLRCNKKMKSNKAKLIFFGNTGYYFCDKHYKEIERFAFK